MILEAIPDSLNNYEQRDHIVQELHTYYMKPSCRVTYEILNTAQKNLMLLTHGNVLVKLFPCVHAVPKLC